MSRCCAFNLLVRLTVGSRLHDDGFYTRLQWLDLLSVSTDLSFPHIRAHAIDKLDSSCMDAVERIGLATQHNIQHWLLTAYNELCSRDSPLCESEALVLGAKITAQIADARERILRDVIFRMHQGLVDIAHPGAECTFPIELRDESSIARIIREVFWAGDNFESSGS